MAVHQDEPAPLKEQGPQFRGSKRAHADIDEASPESVSSPLDGNPNAVLKRQKKDVDAMSLKVAELQKKGDEAKCAREEARKKAEEHQVRHPLPIKSEPRLTVCSETFKSSGLTSQGYSRNWNVRSRKILWLRRHIWYVSTKRSTRIMDSSGIGPVHV